MVGVTERCEVEPGAGEEAVEEAGLTSPARGAILNVEVSSRFKSL